MHYFISQKNSDDLFVLLHGTGGNEYSLLFLTGELNPKSSVISFIGNHMTGENRRYFPSLIEGQLDQLSFGLAVDSFLIEWDKLAMDYQQITFIGYSNGTNLLQGILQRRPTIATRALLLHPQEFHLDFSETIESKTELLITTGANDSLVVPGDIMTLSKRMNTTFTDVDLLITDGHHGVTDEEILGIRKWYQKKWIRG